MAVVTLAMVPLDSHVSRRCMHTDATIVAGRGEHRADGHTASTQFELQANGGQIGGVQNARGCERSRFSQFDV
jgi:hypothetical protein